MLAPPQQHLPACPPTLQQEYVNGQLKNKYGDVFIRGNNGERPAAGTPTASSCQQTAVLPPTANCHTCVPALPVACLCAVLCSVVYQHRAATIAGRLASHDFALRAAGVSAATG